MSAIDFSAVISGNDRDNRTLTGHWMAHTWHEFKIYHNRAL